MYKELYAEIYKLARTLHSKSFDLNERENKFESTFWYNKGRVEVLDQTSDELLKVLNKFAPPHESHSEETKV